jgi:gluconate:H+ symporter, GntP family
MRLIILLILAVVWIIISTTKLKLHPFLALLFATIGFGLFSGMPLNDLIESINGGFGNTIGYIGIVIVAGCIIGTFLEESGGAYTMAEKILKLVGQKNVPLVMSIIGYFISIPVFADSAFVILTPLNKALTKRAGITFAATTMALAFGLMVTHCFVPPTPGPIAAAGILNADLGLVILFGLIVSALALVAGLIFVSRVASRTYIDPDPDLSEDEIKTKMKQAPSAIKAFMPILIPIILIVLKSVSDFPGDPFGAGIIKNILGFVGAPVIALLIGVLLAFLLPKKLDRAMLSSTGWVGKALISAAVIILITGAGGSFGMVLRNSGIADVIGAGLSDLRLSIWLPFIIAACIRTAQGSATVTLITTASILAPLMVSLGFDTNVDKALVVLAIGAGSLVFSHANDSFFWILTQLSNMDVKTGYRLQTVGTGILGFTGMLAIWALFMLNL